MGIEKIEMDDCVSSILITHEEIVNKCKEIGTQITEEYKGKRPLLIGLLRGSVPFFAELIKSIKCDMEMDFMDVCSYADTHSTGVVNIIKDIKSDVSGKHIIFVEDIVDTGITLDCIINLFKRRKAASIEICTLIDKPEGRVRKNVQPKYCGFLIPNKFVVGFGLDYNQLYRNLPYIGILKEEIYRK